MVKKALLFSIITAFLFTPVLHSEEVSYIDLNKVTIPEDFGLIKEVYQSHAMPKRGQKIIFHIQDVHANYEAQKNLANILEYLIMTYGLELILVEGGITDKDFSYIREWAPLEERRKKAEELLKEGIISGETYIDIGSDFPLKFQGIEDKELYEENMEIYLKVDSFRAGALAVIKEFKDVIKRLKKFIYTKRLRKFDKYKRDYKLEKIELVKYLEYLDDIAAEEKVNLHAYRNHSILLETARLENKIDFAKVESERDSLMSRLMKRLPKKIQNELFIKSIKFKEGKISDGKFYSYLHDLSVENDIKMKGYKNLNRYIDYIKNYEKLERGKLFKEINKIEDILSDVLCKNSEQRKLFKISKNLQILEAFLKLKFSPEDFYYYKTNKKDFDIGDWKSFLDYHSKRFGLNVRVPDDTSAIDRNLGTLTSFYEIAFERDDAFLRNSLKRMEKDKLQLAALITGGFHTKNLTRLFEAEDISYIVITPKFTQKTDDKLYDRILKESYRTRIWND